jgi:hypothetical protein
MIICALCVCVCLCYNFVQVCYDEVSVLLLLLTKLLKFLDIEKGQRCR